MLSSGSAGDPAFLQFLTVHRVSFTTFRLFSKRFDMGQFRLNGAALLGTQAQGPSVLPRNLCPFLPKPGADGGPKRLLAYGPQDDEF